ncbi:MFS transporter, partial [Castellaniella sp.]|uniref:MFS transporter n=1 Tax=Castellaniella sp. TaxID=1955812 RepID=UPI0035625B24
ATLLAQAVVSMGALTLPVLAPTLGEVLRVDASLIGYQVSIVYAGAMLSSAVGGQVVLRLGACRATQVALGWVGIAMVLSMVPQLFLLAMAALFLGFGYGVSNPSGAHLLARFTPAGRRNLIFSLKQTGVPLGGMAAALVAPYLAHAFDWRIALACVLVLASLGLLLLQPVRPHWDDDRNSAATQRSQQGWAHAFDGIRLVWRQRDLRYLSLMALCFAGVQLCLMTFTVSFLVKEAGYSLIDAGLLLSAVQFAGAIGRIGWGWLADRWHASRATLLVLSICMLLSTLAITRVDPQWEVWAISVAFIVMGATAIGWNGVFLAEVARLAPSGQVSTATGGALFLTFSGVLMGPSLFAATYAYLRSYADTFIVAAVLVALGLAFLLGSHRPLIRGARAPLR